MANGIIESGNAQVGMRVVTADGAGIIDKVIGQDNILVKLDSGSFIQTDLCRVKQEAAELVETESVK